MIDSMPLDLFDDEPLDDTQDIDARMARCQWCGVEHHAEDAVCPVCGATLLREATETARDVVVERITEPALLSNCPWCSEPVDPEAEECPNCRAVLKGDPNLVLPGVNVPLPDSVLWARTMAEREANEGTDPTGTVIDLLLLLGETLLKTRGRL